MAEAETDGDSTTELAQLNSPQNMGNCIVNVFGFPPLKSKFTPSFKCPMYKMGTMDLTEARSNVFFADEVFYYQTNCIY